MVTKFEVMFLITRFLYGWIGFTIGGRLEHSIIAEVVETAGLITLFVSMVMGFIIGAVIMHLTLKRQSSSLWLVVDAFLSLVSGITLGASVQFLLG